MRGLPGALPDVSMPRELQYSAVHTCLQQGDRSLWFGICLPVKEVAHHMVCVDLEWHRRELC